MNAIRGQLAVVAVAVAAMWLFGCNRSSETKETGDTMLARQNVEILVNDLQAPDPLRQERAARQLATRSPEDLKPHLEKMKALQRAIRDPAGRQALGEAIKKAGG